MRVTNLLEILISTGDEDAYGKIWAYACRMVTGTVHTLNALTDFAEAICPPPAHMRIVEILKLIDGADYLDAYLEVWDVLIKQHISPMDTGSALMDMVYDICKSVPSSNT